MGPSIVHLLLVLAALSLGASLTMRGWFGRPEVTLDNAARLLAEDLRDAQNRAAFRHSMVRIVFHRGGSGYDVIDPHGEAVRAPVGSGPFHRHYSRDAVFRGVRIEEVRLGGHRTVHYGPYGLALTQGEVVLTFKDERRTVRIVDATGRIEIDGLSSPWTDVEY